MGFLEEMTKTGAEQVHDETRNSVLPENKKFLKTVGACERTGCQLERVPTAHMGTIWLSK